MAGLFGYSSPQPQFDPATLPNFAQMQVPQASLAEPDPSSLPSFSQMPVPAPPPQPQPGIAGPMPRPLGGIAGIGAALASIPAGIVDNIQNARFQRQMERAQATVGFQNYQRMMAVIGAMPDDDPRKMAAMSNLAEYGKALSSNYAQHTVAPGATDVMNGGATSGETNTAPVLGMDDKSGRGYMLTPGAMTPLGPSLGGDIAVSPTGIINSGRTGPVGSFSLPQTVGPGVTGVPFTPTITPTGEAPPTAPAVPGAGPTIPQQDPNAPPPPTAFAGARHRGLISTADVHAMAPNGQLDPLAFYRSFILPHEGGLNPSDMNGSPTNYGFNQAANRDIDVRSLTPDAAAQRFAATYFPQSGAGSLPPALAAVHADTSFINPSVAKRLLQASGGDAATYMRLRGEWMDKLAAQNPRAAKYATAWRRRNADLSAVASQLGGGAAPAPTAGAPAAPAATDSPAPASQAAPAPTNGPGFGAPFVQGKTNTDVPPAEAIRLGLAPGRWQTDPTGRRVLVSPAPAADVKRVEDMGAGLDTLQGLRETMEQFNQHYQHSNMDTGPQFTPLEVHGLNLNPISALAPRLHGDIGAMEALHNKQTFLAKPANAGARILQAEIPFWTGSVQEIDNAHEVNDARYQDTLRAQQLLQAKHQFFQSWLYQNGTLNGADAAFAAQQHATPAGAAPAAQPSHAATSAVPARPAPPRPGQVVGGYTFLGGDPANPASWRK